MSITYTHAHTHAPLTQPPTYPSTHARPHSKQQAMATPGPGHGHGHGGGQPYGYSYPPHPRGPHQHQPEMRFIPVSVSKSARSYFNIARKALETHRRVELSALEAAVVIAVDASFLLTRAKMGAVERVNTAFVQVPSHQPGYQGHLRKARIQIVIARTREYAGGGGWLDRNLAVELLTSIPSFRSYDGQGQPFIVDHERLRLIRKRPSNHPTQTQHNSGV